MVTNNFNGPIRNCQIGSHNTSTTMVVVTGVTPGDISVQLGNHIGVTDSVEVKVSQSHQSETI
jgi:hypothetical protein